MINFAKALGAIVCVALPLWGFAAVGFEAFAGDSSHAAKYETVTAVETSPRPQARPWTDLAPVKSIRPQARPAHWQFENSNTEAAEAEISDLSAKEVQDLSERLAQQMIINRVVDGLKQK